MFLRDEFCLNGHLLRLYMYIIAIKKGRNKNANTQNNNGSRESGIGEVPFAVPGPSLLKGKRQLDKGTKNTRW